MSSCSDVYKRVFVREIYQEEIEKKRLYIKLYTKRNHFIGVKKDLLINEIYGCSSSSFYKHKINLFTTKKCLF